MGLRLGAAQDELEEVDDGVALSTELGRWPGGRAVLQPAMNVVDIMRAAGVLDARPGLSGARMFGRPPCTPRLLYWVLSVASRCSP